MTTCPDDPLTAVAAVALLIVGIPAGWAMVWAMVRFVNHRWPARG